jgi:eukaryotic-like serine/threonine-protein kinase
MTNFADIDELLLQWESARQAGRPVEPGDLCPSWTEGQAELRRRIELLCKFDTAFGLQRQTAASEDGLEGVPAIPGCAIRGELGRGGMGMVYRAWQEDLNREVAVKVMRGGPNLPPQLTRRFVQEARLLARLRHDHIVPVLEAKLHLGEPYFVMELVRGGSLAAAVNRYVGNPTAVARLMEQVATAVHHAHEHGVLHRDLKPANILLDEQGRPQVSDFGLAKILNARSEEVMGVESGAELVEEGKHLTANGVLLGTPPYMAPEQFDISFGAIGRPTDVWALGVILYELVTGQNPFAGGRRAELRERVCRGVPPRPRSLGPTIDRGLEAIILHCLEKHPGRRYPGCRELAADLRNWLDNRPIAASPPGLVTRFLLACRRRPALAAAVVLGSMASLAAVAFAGSMVVTLYAKKAQAELQKEKDGAEEARRLAEVYRKKAELATARLALEQGLNFCQQGDVHRGLLLLAHALGLTPDDAADLQRAIRANIAAWSRQVSPPLEYLAHGENVMAVGFQPGGQRLITVTRNNGVKGSKAWLWEGEGGGPRELPLTQDDVLLAAAFSPDGKLLLTGGTDEKARLWDAVTGRPLLVLVHAAAVHAVAFSPDGQRLLTGAEDSTFRLWEATTGAPLGGTILHPGPVRALAFSPDGRTAVVGGADHTARLWDLTTSSPLGEAVSHNGSVTTVAFSLDGRSFVTGSQDKTVQIWATATRQPLGPPLRHPERVYAAAFSPDSQMLLTACGSWDQHQGEARLWDVSTGTCIGPPLPHDKHVFAVAFSPDGKQLATGCADGLARLWKVALGLAPTKVFPHEASVKAVAFNRDGSRVVTGGWDGKARVWETTNGHLVGSPVVHADVVHAVALSADGKIVLTGSGDGSARLWDASSGTPVGPSVRHPGGASISAVAFCPDGVSFLTGGTDSKVYQWNSLERRLMGPVLEQQGAVIAIGFGPAPDALFAGCTEGAPRLWNTATGIPLGPTYPHPGQVSAAALSPNGKVVGTGGKDGTARLWDVVTGIPFGVPLSQRRGWVVSIGFSADSASIITGSQDGTAQVWDVGTGVPIGPPLRHVGMVRAIAFNPVGGSFLTGGDFKCALLWPAPEPVRGDAERVAMFVKVLAIADLTAEGFRRLDPAELRRCQLRLKEMGGPPL